MENFFDKSLHFLGKQNKEVFVLNIGAMDGVMFDEMIGYTTTQFLVEKISKHSYSISILLPKKWA